MYFDLLFAKAIAEERIRDVWREVERDRLIRASKNTSQAQEGMMRIGSILDGWWNNIGELMNIKSWRSGSDARFTGR